MYNRITDPLSSCHQSQAHRAHANPILTSGTQVHPLERGGAEQLRVRQRWEGALPRDVGPGRGGPCLERYALLIRNLLHLSSLGLARFLCSVQTERAKVFVPLRYCSFTKPSQLSSHTNPNKEYCSIESIEHFILVQEDVWLKHAVVFLDYFGVQCKCRLLNKLLLII